MASRHSTLAPRARERAQTRPERAVVKGRKVSFKAKRDALTRVRHDLRSVVHSVVGYSDLLAGERYGALSPDQARFVSHVRSAAEQLQELVDACIELSRPACDRHATELPPVRLGQALKRIRNGLLGKELVCNLRVDPELEGRQFVLDLPPIEKALLGLALVVSREGALACVLCVRPRDESIVICLTSNDLEDPSSCLTVPDELEDHTGNRDFVRLKVGEVLLARQNISLRLTRTLDRIELVLYG